MIKFVIINQSKPFDEKIISEFITTMQENKKLNTCNIYEHFENTWKGIIKFKQGSLYFVDFENEVYKTTSQLLIHIYPQEKTTAFDSNLETLKINIKDIFLNLWTNSRCIWLEDMQMVELSRKLYSEISNVENSLKYFINKVMLNTFGVTWWEDLIPQTLKDKLIDKSQLFKRDVPSFRNVSDCLLSINCSNLMDIMTIKMTKWIPSPSESLQKAINDNNAEMALELLKKQCCNVVDLWDDLFGNLFEDKFRDELWKNFCSNYNHITQNKLLDYTSFELIKQNIEETCSSIENASKKYKSAVENNEIKLEIKDKLDLSKNVEVLKDKLERDSGIKILNEEEIFNELKKEIFKYVSDIAGSLYFRKDLAINSNEISFENEETVLLAINSKIRNDNLKLNSSLYINDGIGAASTVTLSLSVNSEIIDTYELSYTNGQATIDEETGAGIVKTVNKLNNENIDGFFKMLIQTSDNLFPNLMENLDALRYQSVKAKGFNPISDLPCSECGEEAVCLDSSLAIPGRCISCGKEHEIRKCDHCGNYFIPLPENEDYICEACQHII